MLQKKKKLARNVASEDKKYIEKMFGETRIQNNNTISEIISNLKALISRFGENNPVFRQAFNYITSNDDVPLSTSTNVENSPYFVKETIQPVENEIVSATQELMSCSSAILKANHISNEDGMKLVIIKSIKVSEVGLLVVVIKVAISRGADVKREVARKETNRQTRNVKFLTEEDGSLKIGFKKYGKNNWSAILKDKQYKCHKSRN